MTIQEAIKSGKRFRLKSKYNSGEFPSDWSYYGEETGVCDAGGAGRKFEAWEILSNDWVVDGTPKTIKKTFYRPVSFANGNKLYFGEWRMERIPLFEGKFIRLEERKEMVPGE